MPSFIDRSGSDDPVAPEDGTAEPSSLDRQATECTAQPSAASGIAEDAEGSQSSDMSETDLIGELDAAPALRSYRQCCPNASRAARFADRLLAATTRDTLPLA
eukprot:673474-Prymnesium_polylepis.3